MCCHAWLYRLLARMDLSELAAPAELVTKGARVLVRKSNTHRTAIPSEHVEDAGVSSVFVHLLSAHSHRSVCLSSGVSYKWYKLKRVKIKIEMHVSAQVADECLAPDVLSTTKEMKAVNFRRVPKMPVYGVAQPTSEVQQIRSYSLSYLFTLWWYLIKSFVNSILKHQKRECLFHKLHSRDDYLLIIRWCWLTNQEKRFGCDLRAAVFKFALPFLYFHTNMINGLRSDAWWFGSPAGCSSWSSSCLLSNSEISMCRLPGQF